MSALYGQNVNMMVVLSDTDEANFDFNRDANKQKFWHLDGENLHIERQALKNSFHAWMSKWRCRFTLRSDELVKI